MLTKLDLMDDGTDAYDILSNQLVPLRHGWIGVISRSQRDLDTRTPAATALAAESRFLATHPRYRAIAGVNGTAYLRGTLERRLAEHIRKCVPELAKSVRRELVRHETELCGVISGGDVSGK